MRFTVGDYVDRKVYGKDNRPIYVKDYEVGVPLKDKVIYILEASGVTQDELGRVLGFKSNEVHYMKGGWMPSKNVISAINKLYRLWYELKENISGE